MTYGLHNSFNRITTPEREQCSPDLFPFLIHQTYFIQMLFLLIM